MSITNFEKIELLVPMAGENNGTTFTDYSLRSRTVTRVNAVTSTAQSKFSAYGSSGYFDGNGDYLRVADDAAFQPGSGEFCFGYWVRPNATPSSGASYGLVNKGDHLVFSAFLTQYNSDTKFTFLSSAGSSWNINLTSTGTFADSNWYYVECGRYGNVFYLTVNGELQASTTQSITVTPATGKVLLIGTYSTGGTAPSWSNSYMQDFWVMKGYSLFRGTNFTPPARATQRTLTRASTGTDSHQYDRAVLFDWNAGDGSSLSTSVIPDSEGDFTTSNLIDLEYGVAFIKDGCGPVCRGPFEVDPDA